MSDAGTPFRDYVRALSAEMTWDEMADRSGRNLPAEWWQRVVKFGPWSERGGKRVTAPAMHAIAGITVLFRLPRDRIAEMIAEDWYGVRSIETVQHGNRLEPVTVFADKLLELLEQLRDTGTDLSELPVYLDQVTHYDAWTGDVEVIDGIYLQSAGSPDRGRGGDREHGR